MKIGIFTYGTRGDCQPYISLALGLIEKGHKVSIAATEDFRELVEGYHVPFQPLFGNAETMMNSPEGKAILQSENPIRLMKFYFKVLHDTRAPLRETYFNAIQQVDCIVANTMTIPIVSVIAEKQQKKMALTYFMPPMVPTGAFPLGDLDFFNFPWYNKMTYRIARWFFWRFVKKDTNEYRRQLGLSVLANNLLHHIDKQKILDLYCFSPTLIPPPKDWESHHQVTGFLPSPVKQETATGIDQTPPELTNWLMQGSKPIYIGFGSNGIGNIEKFTRIITAVAACNNERVLFCTGWSRFGEIPAHKNLFVTRYVHHDTVLPQCKLGIFHGGAGTLAAMLRNKLPVIIVSFYTDQPTWGKIVEKNKLGLHIPAKKITAGKLIDAIRRVQTEEIRNNVLRTGEAIRNEKGLDNAVAAIERYFNQV
jgi:sterol 3beta-glucosyltransferase